jgi:hypothetical protein
LGKIARSNFRSAPIFHQETILKAFAIAIAIQLILVAVPSLAAEPDYRFFLCKASGTFGGGTPIPGMVPIYQIDFERSVRVARGGEMPVTITPERISWLNVSRSADGSEYRDEASIDRRTGALWNKTTKTESGEKPSITEIKGTCELAAPTPAETGVPSFMVDRTPAQLARDAFATTWGNRLVAAWAQALMEGADAECLRSTGIAGNTDLFEERARAIMVGVGTRQMEVAFSSMDTKKLTRVFLAEAGKDAIADFVRLKDEPLIKQLNALAEPARMGGIVDNAMEVAERATMLIVDKRIAHVHPTGTGKEPLMSEMEAFEDDRPFQKFVDAHDTPDVDRWLALAAAQGKALQASQRIEKFILLNPKDFAPDLPAELTRLCIKLRPPRSGSKQ